MRVSRICYDFIGHPLGFIHANLSAMKHFFFQAEDGIRDRDVTGVQTCALPICSDRFSVLARILPFPGTRPDSTIFRYSHSF